METLAQFSIRTTELLFSKDNRTSFTKKEVVEAILCGGGWISAVENKNDITLNDVIMNVNKAKLPFPHYSAPLFPSNKEAKERLNSIKINNQGSFKSLNESIGHLFLPIEGATEDSAITHAAIIRAGKLRTLVAV